MDPKQLEWLEKELAGSGSDWKIAFFHHPMYASGMHGSDEILKGQLEPLFVKHGVNVVFTGHEHFYERIKPQKGIQYFVEGQLGQAPQGRHRSPQRPDGVRLRQRLHVHAGGNRR